MSASRRESSSLPYVESVLNYVTNGTEVLRNHIYDPPPGTPQNNAVFAGHVAPIHDARALSYSPAVDREGFARIAHASAVVDFYNEDELLRVYYPEAERLMAAATGASRVVVADHTIRRRQRGVDDRTAGAPRQPVPRVHNDYTEKSGPQRVRDLMGDAADDLLRRRFAIINVWRPIRGPLRTLRLPSATPGAWRQGILLRPNSPILIAPGRRIWFATARATNGSLRPTCSRMRCFY